MDCKRETLTGDVIPKVQKGDIVHLPLERLCTRAPKSSDLAFFFAKSTICLLFLSKIFFQEQKREETLQDKKLYLKFRVQFKVTNYSPWGGGFL
jgi:hypothetical protein